MGKFKKELELLINKHSIENTLDMPDFMIAEMLCDLIIKIGKVSRKNLKWHGLDSVYVTGEEDEGGN